MSGGKTTSFQPLVSVVLTTRDRPRFLATALSCYRNFEYPYRELIVVDDGAVYPADATIVEAVGGRLVRMAPGTPIGTKLNRGLQDARGAWCQKMDDDDWYGPDFLTDIISAVSARRSEVCRPVVAFVMPFLFFELAPWEIRRSIVNNLPGATLAFAREDWQHSPFRPLFQDEDLWFIQDQTRNGAYTLPVRSPKSLQSYLAVRHSDTGRDRGHTWVRQVDGRSLEEYLQQERPLYKRPEEILPEWALGFYQELRTELLASA